MDVATARQIVANPERAPTQGDWALAGRVLYDFWQKHPETLRPAAAGRITTDLVRPRRPTRDQLPKRKLRLNGPANKYRIETDADGSVWLTEFEGAQTGKSPPRSSAELMNAAGPLPMGETQESYAFGDALERSRRAQAQRAAGAAFASEQNERMRKHWGQQA